MMEATMQRKRRSNDNTLALRNLIDSTQQLEFLFSLEEFINNNQEHNITDLVNETLAGSLWVYNIYNVSKI